MLKTQKTIERLEKSPTRVHLPVKIKSPGLLFKKTNTFSSLQKINGYQVYSNGYRERKTLKGQFNRLFTISNKLLLYPNKGNSDLTLFTSLNPNFISTQAIDFTQNNESYDNRAFRDYIVRSYKSKSVITAMREMGSKPEPIPKIKCQIDVVSTSHSNKINKSPRTPRVMNKKAMLERSAIITPTNKISRLQKEKLALKESRLKCALSKSPSHISNIHTNSRNNVKGVTIKKNKNPPVVNIKSFVQAKEEKETNEKRNEQYHMPKKDTITSINTSDIPNSTVKKLQVLKEQLAKMKNSSKESRIYAKDNHKDKDSESDNNSDSDSDGYENERKGWNNIQSSSNNYYKTKTEMDSDIDLSSYNSKPLFSVLKGYLE